MTGLIAFVVICLMICGVVALIQTAIDRHNQKVYRAILKAREQVEADRVREQMYRMYKYAAEEVDRLSA